MRTKVEWRRHPKHGYMLRGVPYKAGFNQPYCLVATSLLRDNLEVEQLRETWEAQKLRLHVNAGSGNIACSEMYEHDLNTDFVVVDESEVPEHIRTDFLAAIS